MRLSGENASTSSVLHQHWFSTHNIHHQEEDCRESSARMNNYGAVMWSQVTQVTTNRKVMTAESERPSFNRKSFSAKWWQPAREVGYTLNWICSSTHYLSTCCNLIMLTCTDGSAELSVQLHKVSAIFHFLLILSPFEIYWCQIYHADRKKSHIFHVF